MSDEGAGEGDARRDELRAALDRVRGRIDDAAREAGRDPAGVALLPVTKSRPAADVAHLLDLGLDAFGENREQEGAAKAAEVATLRPAGAPRWHMVGRLQRRKANHLVRWADAVDSVDSARLVDALDAATGRAREAQERAEPLRVLVQVSLDGDPDRGGAPAADVPALADRVAGAGHLVLGGLMAVAPLDGDLDPDRAFAALAEVATRVRGDHPEAITLSAGMSDDLDRAIRHGSTCVRVGTALLGGR